MNVREAQMSYRILSRVWHLRVSLPHLSFANYATYTRQSIDGNILKRSRVFCFLFRSFISLIIFSIVIYPLLFYETYSIVCFWNFRYHNFYIFYTNLHPKNYFCHCVMHFFKIKVNDLSYYYYCQQYVFEEMSLFRTL